jgi:hypothetical protein
MILRVAPHLWLGLALAASSVLVAQEPEGARGTHRVPLLTRWFGPDSAAPVVVHMERGGVYWVRLSGPGTPVLQPQGGGQAASVVAVTGAAAEHRWFQVRAIQAGPHVVSVIDQTAGATSLLRLYRDVVATRRTADRRDREVTGGVAVAAGVHTGYRFDPTGGADPGGGSDVEACALIETGGRFGTCVGFARQSLPDAGFIAYWLFLEPRVRLADSDFLAGRRTELGAALRISQALSAGPRHLSPQLLGIGLYVIHRLSTGRHGWSLQGAWQHGRLGNAPETELLDTDRFTAGMIWIP